MCVFEAIRSFSHHSTSLLLFSYLQTASHLLHVPYSGNIMCVTLMCRRLFNGVVPGTQNHDRFFFILYILSRTNHSSIWNIATNGQDVQQACEYDIYTYMYIYSICIYTVYVYTHTIVCGILQGSLLYDAPTPQFAKASSLASRSHSDTSHLVGLLWTNDQPDEETSTWQHTREKHPCIWLDSNPHSQQASDRKATP
jgi:hypothetical protein